MKLVKKGIHPNDLTWYSKCTACGSIFESTLDDLIRDMQKRYSSKLESLNKVHSIELGPCEVCDHKTLVFYREDSWEITNVKREANVTKLKYIYMEKNNEN